MFSEVSLSLDSLEALEFVRVECEDWDEGEDDEHRDEDDE